MRRRLFLLMALVLAATPVRAESNLIESLTEASESMVRVTTRAERVYARGKRLFFDPKTRRFLKAAALRPVRTTYAGAGLILDERGTIVTNAHILKNSAAIAVGLSDGSTIGARFLTAIPGTDLAFIRVDAPRPLKALSFADSDALKLKDRVYTVGASPALRNTLSEGRVTGLARKESGEAFEETQTDILQVSFNIYKGDSGSPLLDGEGRLVGLMAAAITNKNKTAYAIPSNLIKKYYDELSD